MPSLDTLPAPQRAVLSLILAKGKSYDEIAGLLGLEVAAVRERAHLALDALAPRDGARPAPRHRAAIGNYLLGQQVDTAATTFAYLESSVAGRDWARALARALEPLADGRLPSIPPDPDLPASAVAAPAEPAPAEPAAAPPPPPARPPETAPQEDDPPAEDTLSSAPAVSRRGGALLIAGGVVLLAAVVAAAVLLFTGGTGRKATPKPAAPAATTPQATLAGQITLKPAPGTSARGLAAVFARAARRGVAIAVSGLRPTSAHLTYAVWLYNTRTDSQLVGYLPAVKADGRVSAFADIPTGAVRFRTLVLTREVTSRATTPGQILLSGAIPARALG